MALATDTISARQQRGWLGVSSPQDALVQVADVIRANHRWLLCMSLFVLLWTIELYYVQAYTLIDPNGTGPRFEFWAPKVRLLMDLLFVSTLAFWLPRRLLAPVAVATFVINLSLVTYYHFFFRPISVLSVFNNWREGLEVGKLGIDLFPRRKAIGLFCALVAKIVLLWEAGWPTVTWPYRWRISAVFTVAYLALFAAANYVDPLNAILATRGVGRLGVIRGYMGPWLAEIYYLRNEEILDRMNWLKQNYKRDFLTPLEATIPIQPRLVVIQAESLDFSVLGYQARGQEVTPFLNHLRDEAMFYRVRASHFAGGSADADFVALTGVPASQKTNGYAISGYKYENTLPQFLAKHGYKSYAFHGNAGRFYVRRSAFEKMGFAGLNFREELMQKYDLPVDRGGWIRDADVLNMSSQQLREEKPRVCHFIITLTTHTPYNLLGPDEQELFPGTTDVVERYFSCMRYLDNCLRNYVSSLPRGTTVLIYADHPTEVNGYGFNPDREDAREFVPCFIYDTDRNLSKLQVTRGDPVSIDGSLTLLDVIKYLRAEVAKSYPAEPKPQDKPAEGQAGEVQPPAAAEVR